MAERFNEILSRLRREKGVNQRQAAAALGVSQALLSHYENAVREPGLAFLAAACDYYGVSADYILGRSAYRDSISLPAEKFPGAAACLSATLDLMRAAASLEDSQAQSDFASLMAAQLYELYRLTHDVPELPAELTGALIALRKAQLKNALTPAGVSLPAELIRRIEQELSMLFNE